MILSNPTYHHLLANSNHKRDLSYIGWYDHDIVYTCHPIPRNNATLLDAQHVWWYGRPFRPPNTFHLVMALESNNDSLLCKIFLSSFQGRRFPGFISCLPIQSIHSKVYLNFLLLVIYALWDESKVPPAHSMWGWIKVNLSAVPWKGLNEPYCN